MSAVSKSYRSYNSRAKYGPTAAHLRCVLAFASRCACTTDVADFEICRKIIFHLLTFCSAAMRLLPILGAVLAGTTVLGHAAQFQVGSGSRVDFGDARVNFGCTDFSVVGAATANAAQLSGIDNLAIGGSLAGGSGQLSLAGNFTSPGTFAAGNSTVSISDGCARTTSQVGGDLTFLGFSASTSTGKTLQFVGGVTTTVTGQLTLQGAPGNLLKIRSTTPGSPSLLSATSLQSIQFVDVADNRAVGEAIAFGIPENYQSQTSGNIFRWFQYNEAGGIDPRALPGWSSSMKSIPSLSSVGTGVLVALLALVGGFYIRRRGVLSGT